VIIWINEDGNEYFFDKNEYIAEINLYTKKYGAEEIYLRLDKIIFDKLYKKQTRNGYIYKMFTFYEYGRYIILHFEKEKLEEKYFINWNNNIDNFITHLNILFKEENIK
jgi:hypothetical protein